MLEPPTISLILYRPSRGWSSPLATECPQTLLPFCMHREVENPSQAEKTTAMLMCVGALVHADCLSCCRETSLEFMHVLQPLVGCIMSLLALGARSRYSY